MPTQPLSEALSDPGRFAYCGLVTAALCHLFCESPRPPADGGAPSPDLDNSADVDFALATLARLARHLGLPDQVRKHPALMIPM